jgi:hypothetical protein
MNTIDLRTVDKIRLDVIREIAALNDKEWKMFLTLLKEREPDLFRELFPKGGELHDAT